jgi:alpha-ketoglutarate-dependent 2,4-dichlorophenoxyacetate dioxygenase
MILTPVEGGFGMVASNVDLRGPGLESTVQQIERALDEHLLIVFRNAGLSLEEYVAFGRRFGEIEDFGMSLAGAGNTVAISNLTPEGDIMPADSPWRRSIAADALWHTDHTYMVRRARYSMLMAEIVPSRGGETQFADTRAAYDALPDTRKAELEGLVAVHSIIYSRALAGFTDWTDEQRARLPPVPQPLVFRNSRTGRRSLYLASHIAEIVGWPTGVSRELVAELIAHATRWRFVHTHSWRPGDIVIWDDRATMHRRAPYDDLAEARKLHTMRVIEPSELYDPAVPLEIH